MPWLSTFAVPASEMRDDDPEESVTDETPDGLDEQRSITTPLTLKALAAFMKPVNSCKTVYEE